MPEFFAAAAVFCSTQYYIAMENSGILVRFPVTVSVFFICARIIFSSRRENKVVNIFLSFVSNGVVISLYFPFLRLMSCCVWAEMSNVKIEYKKEKNFCLIFHSRDI